MKRLLIAVNQYGDVCTVSRFSAFELFGQEDLPAHYIDRIEVAGGIVDLVYPKSHTAPSLAAVDRVMQWFEKYPIAIIGR